MRQMKWLWLLSCRASSHFDRIHAVNLEAIECGGFHRSCRDRWVICMALDHEARARALSHTVERWSRLTACFGLHAQ